ncbi:MAG: O-antigen ligase family protein [Gammaproteobacteria bacterium]
MDTVRSPAGDKLRTFAAYVLFGVVALVPLPFGSDTLLAAAFWCIIIGAACIAIATSVDYIRKEVMWLLAGIGIIVLIYGFVLHEQLSAHPWIATPNPIWAKTSRLLGVHLTPYVSIVRGEPFFALGPPLACILALTCGLLVGLDRLRAHQMLKVIAWSGAVYALYGLVSHVFDPTEILWREKKYYLGSVTGTFINRNTAAAYFGSCAVVWLALLLDQLRHHLKMRKVIWRKVPERVLTDTPRILIVYFGAWFVCLMAMFLTVSRAGVVLSLLAMVVTFVLYFRRDLPPRSGTWIALGGGLLAMLILLQFMGGLVTHRLDTQGLADEGRFSVYRSTLRMIGDYPWFGTGQGTFEWAFPAYRSSGISMRGIWDIAHSTPLQLASEMGLPLAGAVAVGWLVIFWILFRGILTRRRDTIIPLAAFSTALIAVLHSCIDFSLQLTGYSVVIFALTGAGLSQSFGTRGPKSATNEGQIAAEMPNIRGSADSG